MTNNETRLRSNTLECLLLAIFFLIAAGITTAWWRTMFGVVCAGYLVLGVASAHLARKYEQKDGAK